MSRLIFLLALGMVGYLIYKLYFKQLMQQGSAGKFKITLIVVGVMFLGLALTGRAPALFAILGAAMTQVMRIAPLLIRFAPFLRKYLGGAAGLGGLGSAFSGQGGQSPQSTVRTSFLVMTLDHSTGDITGEVISGEFAGKQLGTLSTTELKQLYNECQQNDPEAVRVLQAYIARHRSDWADAPRDDNASQNALSDGISVREACDILGVAQEASRAEVTQAHRALMSQFHPDKGGSNYLASKINEAKKVLLERT